MPQTKMSTNLFGEEQADPPPAQVAPAAEKPAKEKKDRIRGIVKVNISGELSRIEMRESGVTVRRVGKKHVDHKSMQAVLDWATGQAQLPFDKTESSSPELNVMDAMMSELLEVCVEFIACHIAEANAPGKFQMRYQMASSALQEQVELMAPRKVAERLHKITGK